MHRAVVHEMCDWNICIFLPILPSVDLGAVSRMLLLTALHEPCLPGPGFLWGQLWEWSHWAEVYQMTVSRAPALMSPAVEEIHPCSTSLTGLGVAGLCDRCPFDGV